MMFTNVSTVQPGLYDDMVTSEASVTSSSTDYDAAVPDNYLFRDKRLKQFVEYRTASWIDLIYAPICAGGGILGNLLSICVLQGSPRLSGSSASVYMSALAVYDIIVQVDNILWLCYTFGQPVMTRWTCGLLYFLLYFSIHNSVTVMMAMTLERYLAVRYPLKASYWCTPRRARVVVIILCVVILIIDVQHLVIRRMVYQDALKAEVCSPDGPFNEFFLYKIWPWIDGVLYCYLPFGSLAVLNVLIIRQMRASSKFRGNSASISSNEQSEVNRQVTVMLLAVTGAFFLLVGPMAVIIVVERYCWVRDTPHQQAVFHLTRTILNNLSYTNHAINFCLYCLSGGRFREEFLRMFCRCVVPSISSKLHRQQHHRQRRGKASSHSADQLKINTVELTCL